MDKLIIDGFEIYSNLPESGTIGVFNPLICEQNLTLLEQRDRNTIYETETSIIKTQTLDSFDSINDNGDYACKSSIILEGVVLSILNKLNSPHIPRFIGMYTCNGSVYLEMEKIRGSTLTELHQNLSDEQKEAVLFQVLYALYQFKTYEFSHGDLIGSNIMIETVEEQNIEYVINGKIHTMSNRGINIRLIDFEFSRITAYGVYIFNESTRKKYHSSEFDVPYNQAVDICKLIGNPNLMTDRMKTKNIIECEYDRRYNVIPPFPNIDIYNTIAMFFDLEPKEENIKTKTINEDRSLLNEENIKRSYELRGYYIADYPELKFESYYGNINIKRIFDYLVENKYNRLLYRLLTYFPGIKINQFKIKVGIHSYSNNRKIINKMEQISKLNDTKLTQKLFEDVRHTEKQENKIELENSAYDPIMLEYVNIEQWLLNEDNIIFILGEKKYASCRSYFKQIPNGNILVDVILTNNILDHMKTLKSVKYVNLNKYGIDAIINYKHFLDGMQSKQQEYTIIRLDTSILGSNFELLSHNPQSYVLKDKDVYGFEPLHHYALKNYTRKWDRAINIYLRSKMSDEDYLHDSEFLKYHLEFGDYPEESLENIKDVIKNIDAAFLNSMITTSEFVLFRGTQDCSLYDGLNPGFISTSISYIIASDFVGKNGCIYEMHITPGIPYIYMESITEYEGEKEILLPRNLITVLREKKGNIYVVDVISSKDDQFIFDMEYKEYTTSKLDGFVLIEQTKDASKCYKNSIKDGNIIDEISGEKINENDCISNDGMCYAKETLCGILETSIAEEHIFLDPFTQIPFSNDIIAEVIDSSGIESNKLLSYFSGFGNLELVKILIEGGADIHHKDSNALINAINRGNVDVLEFLIDANVNDRDGDALISASSCGYLDIVIRLIEKCKESFGVINPRRTYINSQGGKALVEASSNGHLDVVKFLIKKTRERGRVYGINVNVQNGQALIDASTNGHLEVVKVLIEGPKDQIDLHSYPHGVDVNNQSGKALIGASKEGHLEIVKVLIEHGADVNIQDGQALMEASSNGYLDIAKFLIKHGADIKDGRALISASGNGYLNIVKLLLEVYRDPDGIYNSQIDEAILKASTGGYLEIVRLLIEGYTRVMIKGFREDDVNAQGGQALIEASSRGYLDIAKLLIRHGADIQNGKALIEASKNGYLTMVELLIENGARVNDGKALVDASSNGHLEIVNLLIKHGADGKDGKALVKASSNGHLEVVEALFEGPFGSDLDVNTQCGKALINASSGGYLDIVNLLIKRGANVNSKQGKSLLDASSNGHLEVVKVLLEHGAVVNSQFLIGASSNGHLEIVKLLLDHMRNKNVQHNNNEQALYNAASGGYLEIVKLLIKHGADIKDGYALNGAVVNGHFDTVKFLLEYGIIVEYGRSLILASERGYLDIVKLLIEGSKKFPGIGVEDSRDIKIGDALVAASFGGHLEIVKFLIKNGANVNHNNGEALITAVKNKHTDAVEVLLKYGVDVDSKNGEALRYASKNNYLGIVKLLVQYEANIKDGNALSIAASYGHFEVSKFLLEQGANVQEGTALIGAAESGHLNIVELLVKYGADVNVHNSRVLMNTTSIGHLDVIEYLIKCGVNANAQNGQALINSVYMGHTKIVKCLLEYGVDPNFQDGKALMFAKSKGRTSIIELLLEYGATKGV